ncbi:hypothetical protein V3C99_001087 [Haemonchus contortus]
MEMLLVFGVLLLTSSVLSENDKIDTIYKAIKDIIGFDRNELFELSKTGTAIVLGSQVTIVNCPWAQILACRGPRVQVKTRCTICCVGGRGTSNLGD